MKIIKNGYGIIAGLIAFIVYLLTVSHSVVALDAGELAAVQATLGIAHPPGYPLFTILGYFFLKIPLGLKSIYQLNILCSVWCAGAVTFFTYTTMLVLNNLGQLRTTKESELSKKIYYIIDKNGQETELIKYIVSIISGLFFAFSLLLWFQSTAVEVYSLQFFLFSVLLYLFLRACFYGDNKSIFSGSNKLWIIVGIFFGFSFSNHLMTFYLLPAFLFLYFNKYKFTARSIFRLVLVALIAVTVTLSLYSYLIIRAGQDPLLNWGNPDDLEKAVNHISAKYYNGKFFAGIDPLIRQLKFLFNSFGFYDGKLFAGDYNINLVFCITGLIISFISLRRFFYFTIILFITTIFFTINYNIPDIYEYFSLSVLSLYLVCIPAYLFIINFLKSKKIGIVLPVLLLLVILFVRVGANYKAADESGNYLVEDYTRAILKTANQNAIIFSNKWDYFVSPSYYLQYAENFRQDIRVIQNQLLIFPWYLAEFKSRNGVIINSNDYIDISSIINNKEREIYLTPEMLSEDIKRGLFRIPPESKIIPDVLLFRIVNDDKYYPAPDPNFSIRLSETKDPLLKHIEELICYMLVNRIRYELKFDKYNRAKIYYIKLKTDFKNFSIPTDVDKSLSTWKANDNIQ